MSSVLTRADFSFRFQVIWNDSATQVKSRSSSAAWRPGCGTEKCTRMKNRPPSGSPNCWLVMMLAERCTRKPDTAYTMPGLSGQERVRMNSSPVGSSVLISPPFGTAVRYVKDRVGTAPHVCPQRQMYVGRSCAVTSELPPMRRPTLG